MKVQEKETVIQRKVEIAKNYFTEVDMKILYPKLFRILWESTLPCFKEEHMLLSCEVAGVNVDCSDYFTRVPTDAGMCCALNVESSLRTSEYSDLVKEMQGNKTTKKVQNEIQKIKENEKRFQHVQAKPPSFPKKQQQLVLQKLDELSNNLPKD